MKNFLFDKILVFPQYVIPQHLLSRLIFKLTRLQLGVITHWVIRRFIQYYQIDMNIAQQSEVRHYTHFNHFFTRSLKLTARPIATATITSPVDGQISQIGQIDKGCLVQAKGYFFQLNDLLARNAKITHLFQSGLFCTLYLSPKDYHRIHMPITGQLTDMIYVPGRLFSVNQRTTRVVSRLFTRNERVICLFETDVGPMALILVGALLVGSIETVWAGMITPSTQSQPQHWHYGKTKSIILDKGMEMGRFNMGSTVIVLLDAHQVTWLSHLTTTHKLLMGQALAQSLR